MPGFKARPGLVRSLQISSDHTKYMVDVTYGTSKISAGDALADLIVSNMANIEASGLPCATRFALDHSVWLPWASEFFENRDGYKTPVIGHLDQTSTAQLEAIKVFRRTIGRKP